MRISDWSSDVCSSDLCPGRRKPAGCKRIQSADPQTATSGTPVAAAATGEPMASVELDKLRKVYPNGFRSEEHTSELQSLMRISYAVFCLKKNTRNTQSICN